jgi:glycine oxidase
MRQPDVLIIGGGVIGCAVAYFLTRLSSLHVLLVERETVGAGASNAAAGVLAVASSRAPRGVLFELRRRSAAMFPDLVAALHAETGIDCQCVQRGLLEVAFTVKEAEGLNGLVRRRCEQGFRAELLDATEARRREPTLADEITAAALFGDDHSINNERFTAALAAAAQRRGAELRLGTAVTAVEVGRNRVLRLRAADDWLSPGVVIVAAGVGSPEIGRLMQVRIPVRAARGEMLALRPIGALPQHTLTWGDGYLVPRHNGELLVGSTTEYSDTAEVTGKGVATLLRRALRMAPDLSDATVTRTWAGLRPCPTIRRPIIGPVRGFDNLLLATGHHRNGILLAPITGLLMAELVTERATSVPLQPFCYRPR